MNIVEKWKPISILVILALSIWFLIPTIQWYGVMSNKEKADLQKVDFSKWKALNEKKLNLGLDLQGGVSLLLKVDTAALERMSLDKEIDRINTEFTAKNNPTRATLSANSVYIVVTVAEGLSKQDVENVIKGSSMLTKMESPEGKEVWYQLDPRMITNRVQETMEQARHVIENRVNELGLSETLVARVGDDRITVQLPGETDPERATNIIRRQAFLEFKIVADDALANSLLNEQGQVRPGTIIPDGYELKYMRDSREGELINKPILLKKRSELTGEHINGAAVRRDNMSMGQPFVEMNFDREGARIFERVTAMNVNKRLAIVLDGEVKSAPNIQERIPGGKARITGQFTENEARDLSLVLRSGALPAPLVIEESRAVGPSLGYDSIHKGILSALIGCILVILFMIVYYKGSGLVANTALIMNIVVLMAALALLRATLTVPGIAGIVLTIGMAVDANVLIFERIREELRAGKTPRAAIEAGYNRAFSAILDSNVTTVIAAFLLVQFGSSAVKGFAITLMVGLCISMYTAILVTRVIFDYISLKPGFKNLSI